MDNHLPKQHPHANIRKVPHPFIGIGALVFIITVMLLVTVSRAYNTFFPNPQKLTQKSIVINVTPVPTKDPTADWKTYTNPVHKFTLQYPSAMAFEEAKVLSVDRKTQTTYITLISDTDRFLISFEPNPKKLALSRWHSLYNPDPSQPVTSIEIDKQQVLHQETTAVVGSIHFYMPVNDTTILWARGFSVGVPEYRKETEMLLVQVLSTIKSTDNTPSASPSGAQRQTIDISNWKMYTNTKVGFEIKYPPRYTKPELPSYLEPQYATGNETNGPILFGKTSGGERDGFSLLFFPYQGTLDQLPYDSRFRGTPPYNWSEEDNWTVTRKQVNINQHTGIMITKKYNGMLNEYNQDLKDPYIGVFFVIQGYGFSIIPGLEYNQQELDNLLSSFKKMK